MLEIIIAFVKAVGIVCTCFPLCGQHGVIGPDIKSWGLLYFFNLLHSKKISLLFVVVGSVNIFCLSVLCGDFGFFFLRHRSHTRALFSPRFT